MFTKRMLAAALIAAFTALAGAYSQQASADVVRAVEYYHPGIDHLFVTANSQEIDALDSGTVGGWLRTGQRFRVDDAPAADLVPVCRFYTSAYAGKATHFFTASASECEGLKAASDWVYEGVAFYARLPDAAGTCGADAVAVNRLFNGGQGGAPNHAYTVYDGTREMLAQSGWIPEGVAFCAPLAAGNPIVNTQALAGSEWNLPRELPMDDATPGNKIRFQIDRPPGREQQCARTCRPCTVPGAGRWLCLRKRNVGSDRRFLQRDGRRQVRLGQGSNLRRCHRPECSRLHDAQGRWRGRLEPVHRTALSGRAFHGLRARPGTQAIDCARCRLGD